MNILVFSDTHLCLPFNQKKFNFLKKIISEYDQVIINGDFFDSYMNTFDEFVKSPWNKLFPLLKSRNAVYIYGNHDQEQFTNKQMSLFSDVQTANYQLTVNNILFHFEHGEKTRLSTDVMYRNISWPVKHFGMIFVHFARNLLVRTFRNFAILTMFKPRNKISKKMINKIYQPKENEIYIIGHNHYGEIDLKNHFASTGAILYGYSQYLIIDSLTAKITLHEEWYR